MHREHPSWYEVAGWSLGIAVMLIGLVFMFLRRDTVGGYSLLTVGAVIFGTTGVSWRRGRRSDTLH